MPVEVILPKVDMDMATGRISRWFVAEGATVAKGELLFEIETDKAAMEIDAPAAGVLRDITGKEGIDIPVGEAVAWIYEAGEEPAETKTKPAETQTETATEGGADLSARADAAIRPAPAETAPAKPAAPPAGQAEAAAGGGSRATPLARRLARAAGLPLSAIAGSGPHGRVVRADVEAALAAGGGAQQKPPAREPSQAAAPAEAAAPAAAAQPEAGVAKLFAEGTYDLVPHDAMRRTIARRLVEAKSSVPHFYLTLDCELDALLALRAKLNAAAPMRRTEAGEAPAYRLSVNDMVIKAMAMALREVPEANVSWTPDAMIRHRHADVGVAVSIPGGLITPIIRRAEEKTLSTISNEMKDLAQRAKNRKLKPEEYQGGTTAVSNLGMFGIKEFAAIINPPHATILAVGAGEKRAIVRNDELAIATVMSVTLSTDHRAVDGALGAELAAAFKRTIENPLAMLA